MGHIGSLVWKITSLSFEDKFREVMGLGKYVEGYIGLREDNFIALVEEYVFEITM